MGIPTLSLAGVQDITATGARPRVTLAFAVQVAIQAGAKSGTWSNTATPTLDTPAGAAGESQLLIATFSPGGTVSAPTISGWTLEAESFITGSDNRMAVYSRTLGSATAAGTASPTFSGATYGIYWAASINGTPGTISLAQDSTWSNPVGIPSTSALADLSLHLVAVASADWPRSVAAVSGYTEAYDNFAYSASQGLWLGVNHKAVSSGTVAASEWPLYDETGNTLSAEQVIKLSLVLAPT